MATQRKSAERKAASNFGIAQMDLSSNDSITEAYETWLEQASKVGDEAFRFVRQRLLKDFEAATRLLECNDPGEAIRLQAEFASDLAADYVAESQKILGFITEPPVETGSRSR